MSFSKPIPRDYQIEAADAYLDGPNPSAIIQLPTGGGKTLTCAHIFDRFDGRCLFLAYTDELVRQTCRAMLRMGLWPRVEKADEYRGGPYLPDNRERKKLFGNSFPPPGWFTHNKVWISSMQTFVTRLDKYSEDAFDLVTIDECQRSRCSTYLAIVDRLKQFNPQVRLLGLSATPKRADKKNLGLLFPEFAYRMPILDGIDRGWLVDVRGVTVEMKADTAKWKVGSTKNGRDLTDSSLRDSMKSEECIESIVHPILERGEGRKGIVFLPGIDAAEAVAAHLNAMKPGIASFVHGKVPKKERRKRIRAFEDGVTNILTGVDVFIEGFDVPDISLVVMARPTTFDGRFEQMLGRGLRPLAECLVGKNTAEERRAAIAASAKKDCLVMDFVNNTKFKLVSFLDIVLSGADNAKKRAYVNRNLNNRSPEDRRSMREQIDEFDSLFNLSEALRTKGGPPPRIDYTVRDVNLYGAGGTRGKKNVEGNESVVKAQRPASAQLELAHQLFIENAENMSAGVLAQVIESQKRTKCGRKNYGMLLGIGVTKDEIKTRRINWHDANYLRKLVYARPSRDLPGNWWELLERDRTKRNYAEAS